MSDSTLDIRDIPVPVRNLLRRRENRSAERARLQAETERIASIQRWIDSELLPVINDGLLFDTGTTNRISVPADPNITLEDADRIIDAIIEKNSRVCIKHTYDMNGDGRFVFHIECTPL